MTNSEMKKVLIRTSVFAVVSIALMLHRSATKHIMIADASGSAMDRVNADSSYNLLINRNVAAGKENTLIIPLPKSVSSDNIVLEDRSVDHEFSIYIDSREEGFYRDQAIITDLDIIKSATCIQESDSGKVCLDFKMDGLYVNESSLTESSTIEVRFFDPREKYDDIVVVDPEEGGLEAALLLKEIADRDDNQNLKIYFTRLGYYDVTDEKKSELIKDTGADLLIQVAADKSSDVSLNGIGAYYNDKYYLRGFGNADLAACVNYFCSRETGEKSFGALSYDGTDEIILSSEVPATRLSIGYSTGDTDRGKIADKEYNKKMAEGLYKAIVHALEEMK
ncbi:MAG: N-acetylmuramoyl-L-alanine amidase [Butyrivibrio sp.]|nr:N-acetylmuramoyl-L-alanine amidase [Butyrivibrio sp.]